jgi:hypothetical protein
MLRIEALRTNEMGEACGSCAEGRAVLGTRQRKIQRKGICATLGEPPDADPHVLWCERERLAAAPYSINHFKCYAPRVRTPSGPVYVNPAAQNF